MSPLGGRSPGVTLTWRDVSVYAVSRAGFCRRAIRHRRIVNGVTGMVRPGRLVAMLGGSGAGKSTLMAALAHRSPAGTLVDGDIRVNGQPVGPSMRRLSGYMHQHELFVGSLTVREHLTLMRSQHGVLWVLDCAFSVLVVGNLIVFTWRGVWTLLDLYLYPEDQLWSAITSLAVGYSVVGVAFALQLPLSLAVGRLQGSWRLLVADLYHLAAFFGTVNVWRGVWNVLEIFILDEYPELGCWACATLPLALLMALGCGNSVLVRGVFIDGEEPGGRCVIFPCRYLRAFLQDRKQKKREKRRQQLAEQMANSANHATSLPTFVNPPETTL